MFETVFETVLQTRDVAAQYPAQPSPAQPSPAQPPCCYKPVVTFKPNRPVSDARALATFGTESRTP